MHRTLLLRTFAQLCWQRGELDRWQQLIGEAVAIATAATLHHQLAEMRNEYPTQLALLNPTGDTIPTATTNEPNEAN